MQLSAILKSELPRIFSFLIVGGGGFLVHAGVLFWLINVFRFNATLAWFPAFITAVGFTWAVNRALTFKGLGERTVKSEAGRYFLIQCIGAAINFIIYAFLITLAKPSLLALAIGAGAAFLFNYLAIRFLVFGEEKNARADNNPNTIDDIYYEHAMSIPFARKVLIYARRQMYNHFVKSMQPGKNSLILDFGVSEAENDGANMLEKSWAWPANIVCAGIGGGEQIKSANPDVKYVKIIPGEKLPFKDKHFDIAYSNAVFEHVGSRQARGEILAELKRVAKKIYITIPNRWFPIEHHTAIPLLHFFPPLFRAFTRKGKYQYWSKPENLQFLGCADLRQVFIANNLKPKTAFTGIWFGPFSSNIAFWAEQ